MIASMPVGDCVLSFRASDPEGDREMSARGEGVLGGPTERWESSHQESTGEIPAPDTAVLLKD